MTKRAPQVAVPADVPPKVTTKNKKPQPVVLTGHEKVVDILAEKKSEIEAAGGVIEHSRLVLDPIVSKFRTGREAEGEFTKSIQVCGTKANATYTFRDSFAKIDTSVESDLKKLLGTHYPELFDRKKVTTVKNDDASMAKLRELAKVHGFLDLLEEDEFLQPVDDFRKRRYEKRTALTPEQNKALDDVVKQVEVRPALSFK